MKKRYLATLALFIAKFSVMLLGMQNVSKLNHVYAKLQQFFMLSIHDYMKNYLYFILFLQEHYILNCKCDII